MVIVGKIIDGILSTKTIEEKIDYKIDDNGEMVNVSQSEEQQLECLLAKGYKPIDEIEEKKRECKAGEYVRVTPVDMGDHIGFNYEKIIDRNYYMGKVRDLKKELSDSDFKIMKCYEASLVGEPTPYNVAGLHAERQAMRDEISKIDALLTEPLKNH